MKKLILLATFIYLLLATLTYHPDNRIVLKWAGLNNGSIWNIWNVDTQKIGGVGQFNYPPLHYYLDKIQYFVSLPIGGHGYNDWLMSTHTDESGTMLTRYSLALKFSLILFTLASGYVIYLIAKQNDYSKRYTKLIAGLWLFNPITLYSVPIMGQNDVMAITFFLIGWYLLNKQKVMGSSILFGLGASIKMFPLIWVPFLLLSEKRLSSKQKLITMFSSVFVYLLTLLPFISNPIFREAVLNSGVERFFVARIDLGFSDYILIVPILFMFLVLGAINKYKHIQNKDVINKQASILLLVNILFLFFNHFNPQWFLWLIPFWSFWIVKQKNLVASFLLSFLTFIVWSIIIIIFKDSALFIGMLTPLNYNLSLFPSIHSILVLKNVDVELFNNYAHTILAGLGLIYFMYWFKNEEFHKDNFVASFKLNLFKINKRISFAGILIFSGIFMLCLSIFAHIVPAPIAGLIAQFDNYYIFEEQVSNSFTANYDRLNRIDLFLSNDELKNTDNFLIVIKNDNNEVIFQNSFNGFNVGFESVLRFDLPVQAASVNRNYIVQITPLEESANPLKIATTNGADLNSFAIQTYYAKPSGTEFIKFVMTESLSSVQNVLKQNSVLFIALPIILFLAL